MPPCFIPAPILRAAPPPVDPFGHPYFSTLLEPGLVIIAEEFGYWDDSKRRIDLLALDRDGRLVVIELKRTEDGAFEDLQAIRYAAMVANMTSVQVIEAHRQYLEHRINERSGTGADAVARVAVTDEHALGDLLRQMEPQPAGLMIASAKPRIILVSSGFARELTTSVLWLLDQGLDIHCVAIRPYRLGADQIVLHVEQVLPLPRQNMYMTQWKKKVIEAETAP